MPLVISSQGYKAIDQFLCKVGNLHTLFNEKDDEQLIAAAKKTGLFM